ncbi:hypothetical protein KJ855_01945, partial [Patescibacteria group bacterium]|nr:hypothetical protein [Patescibacteria group bacterium]
LFTKLIKVSGVGPKSAISIMDLDEYDKLMEHIEKADVAFIAKASGVGRKTAQKLIVELQGKLVIDDGMPADGELVDALTSLGYKANEYRDVLDKMPGDIDRIEDKIGWVLREIGRAM